MLPLALILCRLGWDWLSVNPVDPNTLYEFERLCTLLGTAEDPRLGEESDVET